MVFEEQADLVRQSYQKMLQGKPEELKEDPYYNYFYNLVDTGRNHADFSYVRLVKSVDEKWVKEIEDALPSLTYLVQHPRKYIEEEREVVNIAMARNVSSESIRHLLAHSNYIDEYREDGTVIPNRILNVYKEESFNTYENRFICSLIAELQFFINRRYNALFNVSKDEMGINFDVGSTIDNYNEVVDYKLKIIIRDKQTDEENEDENKAIFARISDIHRKVNMLAATEFVSIMRRFPAVRHPIVSTNAIAKNKDYKKCHKLWNFIYSYDQVGYKVDMLKQAPNIAGNLKEDIRNSIVWHYAMLHNYISDVDELNLNREKRKKAMELSEMRGLLEQIVDGIDLDEKNLKNLVEKELSSIIRRKAKEKAAAERAAKEIRKKRENADKYAEQSQEKESIEQDEADSETGA